MTTKNIAVLLPMIFRTPFDYRVPEGVCLKIGDFVKVPFGSKSLWGVVWGEALGGVKENKIKEIEQVASHLPPMSEEMRKFIEWVSWYTLAPLGMVLRMSLQGLEEIKKPKLTKPLELNPKICNLSPEQEVAAKILNENLTKGFSVTLLDGVTGSGKTEVYFATIEEIIRSGKQVLVMLPEISLSVQWLERFTQRFGFAPTVWHSNVSKAKKRDAWQNIAKGEVKIVVGARSALFLPFKNLAMIILDEEHEASYKQEEGVIYQARDMAIVRARHENIPALLVSATPSLETEFNIENNRYQRLHLPIRHNNAAMPVVKFIDMRNIKLENGKWITEPLKNAIIKTLGNKNQVMIFMNRRGYAPLMLCKGCGHRFACPHCTAWLVLHKSRGKLLCHHCGHIVASPKQCPECKAEGTIIPYGTGVERIAEELIEIFPNAKIAVLVSDGADNSELITQMTYGNIDILVGTQMIAKGHHFANLAMVGIIDADMGLNGGDLRASERTYQLLHQLSGRAGREKTKGEVYLQTYMPENPVMQALAKGDRDAFMQLEANMRREAQMPPYGKLAALIIEGKDEKQVMEFARSIVDLGHKLKSDAKIFGPAPAPITRLHGKFRYRVLIKTERNFALQKFLSDWLLNLKIPNSIKLKIDVEPYSFV